MAPIGLYGDCEKLAIRFLVVWVLGILEEQLEI